METDRTECPGSELNSPFITQHRSEQPTRPVLPEVSFNYRSGSNSDYGYLHS